MNIINTDERGYRKMEIPSMFTVIILLQLPYNVRLTTDLA